MIHFVSERGNIANNDLHKGQKKAPSLKGTDISDSNTPLFPQTFQEGCALTFKSSFPGSRQATYIALCLQAKKTRLELLSQVREALKSHSIHVQ